MHSFARGILYYFSFLRATLGLGEAGNWPGAVKSNAEWFPIKERAVAQGIFNAGASIGSVIAASAYCNSLGRVWMANNFYDRGFIWNYLVNSLVNYQ